MQQRRQNPDLATKNQHLQDTIQPLESRQMSLPFRWLRTWLFSLLALVALPLGISILFIGAEMQEDLEGDWQEVTAEVSRINDNGIRYDFAVEGLSENDGKFSYELDDFIDLRPNGTITLSWSACDLVSRFIVPQERGEEFTLWVNMDEPSQHSCIPITEDMGTGLVGIGLILIIFSALRLLRTINAAALRPNKQ